MSGIYIPDFELPKEGNWKTIRIYHTGEVARPNWQGDCTFICKAIPVPDHGDLIERKAVLDTFSVHMNRTLHFTTIRDKVPTIIPASNYASKDEDGPCGDNEEPFIPF